MQTGNGNPSPSNVVSISSESDMGLADRVGTSLLAENTEMRQSDSDGGGRSIKG